MKRGLSVLSLIGLLACVLAVGARAAGGEYTVVQCDPLNRASNDVTLDPSQAYTTRPLCGMPEQDFSVKIENVSGAQADRKGRIYWEAPAGLSIVGVKAQAKLRNDNGHRARVFIADGAGHEVKRIINGDASPSGWKHVEWHTANVGHERFTVTLSCEGGDVCPESSKAKAWVRSVRLEVSDDVDPVLERVEGSLFRGGWLRGDQSVQLLTSDQGSGLSAVSVSAGSSSVRSFGGSCPGVLGPEGLSRAFVPCEPRIDSGAVVETGAQPLHDGANQIRICAWDFGSNEDCRQRSVLIDNSPPVLSFSSEQDPSDPELIQVYGKDTASGLSTGEILVRGSEPDQWQPLATIVDDQGLRARVDSSAFAPGQYEFMAKAADVAGNSATTSLRNDGKPMILEFPLRSGVQLKGELKPGGSRRKTLAYGRAGHVGGRLLTASGKPMKHVDVKVVEHFGDGALLSKRTRTVTTDGHGNWSERVPPGPSRRVTASYDGDARYLPDAARIGVLNVRSSARFKVSRRSVREGKRVAFKGKVGHLGAHIPPGGKLIELQVRERPGHWNTVREAFYTKGSGKYKIRYRFGKFYVQNTKFRFRVKVTREQGWPYKAPVRSRQRAVVVKAHK